MNAVATLCACSHCGLPVPAGLVQGDAAEQFCCAGCDAAWQIIHVSGLADFYRLRAAASEDAAKSKAQTTFGKYAAWDDPAFIAAHAKPATGGCLAADLVVEGIHCAACVWLLEKAPRLVPGLVSARASLRACTLRIVWDPAQVELSAVAKTLDTLGYPPHPARAGEAKKVRNREDRRQLAALGAAGCIAGNVMMASVALYFGDWLRMEDGTRTLLRWVCAALGLLALLWPGRVFFRAAWAALLTRTPSLDLPIAVGLLVGGVSGAVNTWLGRGELWFDTLAMLTFLLLVGRYFRFRQQRRADEAVALMFSLTPAEAHRFAGDALEEVPVEALCPGDHLLVRAGERVPADGVVESGEARVNQALLTGESDLLPVKPGDAVLAGSIVEGASVVMRASACGADSRAGRLMAEVERALADRAPAMDFADRLANRFVVFVLCAAAGTLAFWWWKDGAWRGIENAVALLVIACPCALGLATPLTFAAAIGRLAGRNILVKGASALEVLGSKVGGRLVLDKTGTLTQGKPAPIQVVGDESVLGLAAALEKHSLHPLAKAAVAAWGHQPEAQLAVTEVVETAGAGIRGRVAGREMRVGTLAFVGKAALPGRRHPLADVSGREFSDFTPVYIAVDGAISAVAAFGDALRPEAASATADLRRMGWQAQILSGGAEPVVARVAQEAGITQAQGRATPEDKRATVTDLKAQSGGSVVMVGDGVNDAAALAAADAGIAVHGGAEASLAAADIYIAAPGLSPLVELFQAARRTRRTLRLAWAVSLAYNLAFITAAAAGVLKPWMAAVLMPVSSITMVVIALGGTSNRGARNRKEKP